MRNHPMCPFCAVALNITDRNGIQVDFCPRCHGVWLDRGELDKLIERSISAPMGYRRDDDDDYDDEDRYRRNYPSYPMQTPPRPRRKSFLGEIFDFD